MEHKEKYRLFRIAYKSLNFITPTITSIEHSEHNGYHLLCECSQGDFMDNKVFGATFALIKDEKHIKCGRIYDTMNKCFDSKEVRDVYVNYIVHNKFENEGIEYMEKIKTPDNVR